MKKLNFKQLMDDDRMLWVCSFILAFALWLMVIGTVYTTSDKTVRGVPVSFETAVGSQRDLKPILDGPIPVDVTVNGERSIVGGLRPGDLLVEPDMSGVVTAGEYTLRLSASSRLETNFDVVSVHPREIQVRFDRMVTKEIPVEVDLEGITYPEGYVLGEEYVNVQNVMVTGPETEMEQIQRCVARTTVEYPLDGTEVISAPLVLLDKNGVEVEDAHLRLSSDTADVTIPILKVKTLPLTVSFINVPSGFPIEKLKYTLSMQEVQVAGPENIIKTMDELNLGYIDFRDLDLGDYTFNLSLPVGFINLQGEDMVTVSFENPDLKSTTLNISNIKVVNAPKNVTVMVLTRTIPNVRLYGDAATLEQLTSMDMVAEVDLSVRELKEGQSRITANISAPSQQLVWANGIYQVQILVKPKEK